MLSDFLRDAWITWKNPGMKIWISNIKQETTDTHNTDESQNPYAEWKKPGQKKKNRVHIPYDSMYMRL